MKKIQMIQIIQRVEFTSDDVREISCCPKCGFANRQLGLKAAKDIADALVEHQDFWLDKF